MSQVVKNMIVCVCNKYSICTIKTKCKVLKTIWEIIISSYSNSKDMKLLSQDGFYLSSNCHCCLHSLQGVYCSILGQVEQKISLAFGGHHILVLEHLLVYNIPCTVASVFSHVWYLLMLSVELITGWVMNTEQLEEWQSTGETIVLWLLKCLL